MEWVRENWLFIMFALVFIALHFFGYGCGGHRAHGGHGGQKEEEGTGPEGHGERQPGEKGKKGAHGCC